MFDWTIETHVHCGNRSFFSKFPARLHTICIDSFITHLCQQLTVSTFDYGNTASDICKPFAYKLVCL